jgi:hypothetical protein
MIFEDVHWIDPTSLEALGRAVDRIRTLCVLLIITQRPEFEPPWIGQPHVTTLTINRLGGREIAAMIDRVIGNNAIPAKIKQDIIERTDGIPLFIEEMTKAVLEAESHGAAEHMVAAVPSSALAVPASLHASLMARPWYSQRGGADWSGYRARVFSSSIGRCGPPEGSGAEFVARSSRRCRFVVQARRIAPRQLFVQARASAGRRLWDAPA